MNTRWLDSYNVTPPLFSHVSLANPTFYDLQPYYKIIAFESKYKCTSEIETTTSIPQTEN